MVQDVAGQFVQPALEGVAAIPGVRVGAVLHAPVAQEQVVGHEAEGHRVQDVLAHGVQVVTVPNIHRVRPAGQPIHLPVVGRPDQSARGPADQRGAVHQVTAHQAVGELQASVGPQHRPQAAPAGGHDDQGRFVPLGVKWAVALRPKVQGGTCLTQAAGGGAVVEGVLGDRADRIGGGLPAVVHAVGAVVRQEAIGVQAEAVQQQDHGHDHRHRPALEPAGEGTEQHDDHGGQQESAGGRGNGEEVEIAQCAQRQEAQHHHHLEDGAVDVVLPDHLPQQLPVVVVDAPRQRDAEGWDEIGDHAPFRGAPFLPHPPGGQPLLLALFGPAHLAFRSALVRPGVRLRPLQAGDVRVRAHEVAHRHQLEPCDADQEAKEVQCDIAGGDQLLRELEPGRTEQVGEGEGQWDQRVVEAELQEGAG